MDREASAEASESTTHGTRRPSYHVLAIAAACVMPVLAVLLRVPIAQGLWALGGGNVRGLIVVVGVMAAITLPMVYGIHLLATRLGAQWWLLGVVPAGIASVLVLLVPERTHVEDVVRDMQIGPSAGAANALMPTCLIAVAVVFVSAVYVFGILRGDRDTPRGGWRTLGIVHVVGWAVLTTALAFTMV
ncbi:MULTISPECIES: hypothetical protein [Prauserella salsuginis group]|uniref:Yip1 domain-containing protein n=1 Tax=Prauserella salsuginis TaxID=387889 RepID=A0ABW6G6R8_9PSEU|nr:MULTISPECIES: hypothetical protein [Prauserella salsuginis group]MCR3722711.1 hypothetical protein [Prauserella flava]MCR3737234.1 hypothetical protein [Prauserella salsuginis]